MIITAKYNWVQERGAQLKPKKKELVKHIRQSLNLSEVDATDKDLLECFGNTTLAESCRWAIAGEKLRQDLKKHFDLKPFQA